jgi:hypothetical protein
VIAALYIDPRGPYPSMQDVDCWDESRDARKYDGPYPVVAHPPCGPWGRLASFCKYQSADCGPRAVEQVRALGGVLEHPADSVLFKHCDMPRPGELPDGHGGVTIEVDQARWGHVARKRTWLYLVGVRVVGKMPPPREPTHWCRKRPGQVVPAGIRMCSKEQRRRTPPAFAEWLVSLARTVDA